MAISRKSSKAFVDGFVDMMRAKDEGLDDGRHTPETASPTSFHEWCAQVLAPAVRE
ncbi:hypothetical protein ABZ540_32205 [Nocardia xishanensis]|uniref:hypothetical protein n=1 Tax=Nocardia xishanensis TaxID=238964 RepID=UPI003401D150